MAGYISSQNLISQFFPVLIEYTAALICTSLPKGQQCKHNDGYSGWLFYWQMHVYNILVPYNTKCEARGSMYYCLSVYDPAGIKPTTLSISVIYPYLSIKQQKKELSLSKVGYHITKKN